MPGNQNSRLPFRAMTTSELEQYRVVCSGESGITWQAVKDFESLVGGIPVTCVDCPKLVCPTCDREFQPPQYGHCDVCNDVRWIVVMKDVGEQIWMT